ncbi:MAG: RND family transporter [Planctomycetota bacterium]|nr:MAG: RND family transporter [Planctomycetota bacterium]
MPHRLWALGPDRRPHHRQAADAAIRSSRFPIESRRAALGARRHTRRETARGTAAIERKRRMQHLADWLVRHRIAIAVVTLALTAPLAMLGRRLEFDRSIESLYAEDDPHLRDLQLSRRAFGGDEFVIVAWKPPRLFEADGLTLTASAAEDIRSMRDALAEIPGVRATHDLAAALRFPYRRAHVKELLRGILLGYDDQTTAVVAWLEPERATPSEAVPRSETFRRIRALAAAHDPPAQVAGEAIQVHDMFRYVEEDGMVLFRWSLLALSGVILLLLRRIRWVVLPVAVVLVTVAWTEGLLVLARLKLSMVSSMLNSLVTIIGVATVMHAAVHFRDLQAESGLTPPEAARRTLAELAAPVFWTCATTAVGFLSLLCSEITPVRSFGTMMGLASFLVFFVAMTILPSGLSWPSGHLTHPAGLEARIGGWLSRTAAGSLRRPARVLLAASTIVIAALCGLPRLHVETDFSRNFRENSEIVRALNFVEDRLGGAGSWEVNFAAPRVLDENYLERVRQTTAAFRSELGGRGPGRISKVVSLTDGLDLVPRIPFVLNSLPKRLAALDALQAGFVRSLYDADSGRMRIVLRSRERQPAELKNRLIAQAQALAATRHQDVRVTGLFVLLAFLIESLLRDQLLSFVIAVVGVGLTMSVALRSMRLGLVSLAPNLLPIGAVVGVMGWADIPVNIATAMIASVSMGLTIDSTIHYLWHFRRLILAGYRFDRAVAATHATVGRALLFANLALVVGFSVLTASHFVPLIYFGLLVSAAILGGLLSNLFLLPVLLHVLYPVNRADDLFDGLSEPPGGSSVRPRLPRQSTDAPSGR